MFLVHDFLVCSMIGNIVLIINNIQVEILRLSKTEECELLMSKNVWVKLCLYNLFCNGIVLFNYPNYICQIIEIHFFHTIL